MNVKKKYALLTNDVETTSIWFNDLRDDTGEKVVKEGMPLLLDLYAKYGVKSTFFFTAYIGRLHPEVVRMVLRDGHEVGSHGKSHLKENGFDIMPYARQMEHLEYSKKLLEDISGEEVISFRAPALRVSPLTARALLETGFRVDSSIASQRFDFFLSFGSKQKLRFLNAPRLPYRTRAGDIFRKGQSPLVEVPLSATFIPFTGTTMRLFPKFTYMHQKFLHLETSVSGKPAVFGTHPNEFIDESDAERTLKRRSSNLVAYLLTDYVRGRLKVRNLGPVAIPLYDKLIQFYVTKDYVFSTLNEYVSRTFWNEK